MRGARRGLTVVAAAAVLGPLLHVATTAAQQPSWELPRSLVSATLNEPQPTAFAPAALSTEDFTVDRGAGADPSIEATIEPGSFEWVRVAGILVIGRAVVRVTARDASRGTVSYAGRAHSLAARPPGAGTREREVLVPVALVAGRQHPLRAQAWRDGAVRTATFHLRFTPRPEHRGLVLFDSSCSPFGLRTARGSIPNDSMLYVGCKAMITSRDGHDSSSLDVYLLWDQAPDVTIEYLPASPMRDSLYVQRVTGRSGGTTLGSGTTHVDLAYRMGEPIYAGFFGAGIGPYFYQLQDDRLAVETSIQLLTLYAGYVINPTMRVVYFNATALHRYGSMDQGLYLWIEQFRAIDDRLSLNLLLGVNVLVHARHDHFVGRLSAPQGFEIVVRDFLARERNLTAGAFLYPRIADRSYYNVWLRWGSRALFGEVNYIEWQEPFGDDSTSKNRALGLTIGMPLTGFLGYL